MEITSGIQLQQFANHPLPLTAAEIEVRTWSNSGAAVTEISATSPTAQAQVAMSGLEEVFEHVG